MAAPLLWASPNPASSVNAREMNSFRGDLCRNQAENGPEPTFINRFQSGRTAKGVSAFSAEKFAHGGSEMLGFEPLGCSCHSGFQPGGLSCSEAGSWHAPSTRCAPSCPRKHGKVMLAALSNKSNVDCGSSTQKFISHSKPRVDVPCGRLPSSKT